MGWIRRMRLKNALFTMMFFGLLLASLLSVGAFIGCIQCRRFFPNNRSFMDFGQTQAVMIDQSETSAGTEVLFLLLGILQIALPILIFTAAILITSMLFYRVKLKEPLEILNSGAAHIMENDLDFAIPAPPGQDELGQLCSAFEKMRETLLANNQTLWRQAEERKRLNAAFAHDLRNPVTVLKGTAKLLRKGICDEQTIGRLEDYTLRIEQYIESMSSIQRLEQMPVRKKKVPCDLLYGELVDTARLLAPGLSCRVTVPGITAAQRVVEPGETSSAAIGPGEASSAAIGPGETSSTAIGYGGIESSEMLSAELDHGLFMIVAENLIANGARFAKCELEITVEKKAPYILLSVADDGPGFPDELIQNGPKPFGLAGEPARDSASPGLPAENVSHFGMGLYSCQTICLKHGGKLKLENVKGHGAKATAYF